ncbi:thiol peroxidase [Virgibacillus kekensis]|uniref:Thiol peroxidase n=1 Tax=Virgibacillus kekensis TaxID=202261 RepID=A0ABV9DF80_9BACI
MANVTFKENPVTLLGNELSAGDQAPDFTVLTNDLQEAKLSDYEGKVKLISVVPSIDTGVCSEQTQRFNKEAENIGNVQVLTISMDLPFAQKRWREVNKVQELEMLSDHRDADFGEKYGVLIKEMRLLSRSIFVVDSQNKITYTEYVSENTNHPDYDRALQEAKKAK